MPERRPLACHDGSASFVLIFTGAIPPSAALRSLPGSTGVRLRRRVGLGRARLALMGAWALILAGVPVTAHEGGTEFVVPSRWSFDAWVSVPLLIGGVLYLAGTHRLWRRAGVGRGVRRWQVASFMLGWTSLAGALMSPLHWLSGGLFVAHMIEHEIVVIVAAPLIAVARPWGTMLWAFPKPLPRRLGLIRRVSRNAIWRAATAPLFAAILHGAALWAWHMPALYNQALVSQPAHRLQHLTFFVTALLFWRAIAQASTRPAQGGAAVLWLFVTMMHTGLLGALLTMSRSIWYQNQSSLAAQFGLSAIEDQQLAGLVMWVPSGLIYAFAALVAAALWIEQSGKRHAPEEVMRSRPASALATE